MGSASTARVSLEALAELLDSQRTQHRRAKPTPRASDTHGHTPPPEPLQPQDRTALGKPVAFPFSLKRMSGAFDKLVENRYPPVHPHLVMEQPVAHLRRDPSGTLCWQRLMDHLEGVAAKAAEFAAAFGSEQWGRFIGLLHDLGKFHPQWQRYIRQSTDTEASGEDSDNRHAFRPPHSGSGAIAAIGLDRHRGRIAAYCIAGHHGCLRDWYGQLESRLNNPTEQQLYREVSALPEVRTLLSSCSVPTSPPPTVKDQRLDSEQLHLWIRMLYSCLVDADFLDTEAFMRPERAALRGCSPTLAELVQRYDAFMSHKEATAPDTPINRLRRALRQECMAKAALPPGFFSLTLPTGAGKTLTSVGFALHHAHHHNLRRIIIALPYTSIIEQTAAILRYGTDDPEQTRSGATLFGDAVIEHHSNLDPDRETLQSRLASENWDAPIIVTTTVQLFESLLGATPSACRKLHNIAGSVLILDEVQLLPPEHLRAILSVLRGLAEYFRVSCVLMTATMPVLEGTIGKPPASIDGLPNVRPLVSNPHQIAKAFERTTVRLTSPRLEPTTWEELSTQLCQYDQVLCIVNTRRDCRTLYALMPEGTFHLSTLMCPQDRSRTLARIKALLRAGAPVRVISTQLVEAGVDIDFPVVYRALAGLDSIAQAAGRCNREGTLPRGHVVVFIPPQRAPAGLLRKGEDATRQLLGERALGEDGCTIPLDVTTYERYFEHFYGRINSFDTANFFEAFVHEARQGIFEFASFAQRFRIIDDQQQVGVIVRYTDPERGYSSEPLIEQLQRGAVDTTLLRQLQRYTVNLYRTEAELAAQRGLITNVNGYWVQQDEHWYIPGYGIRFDEWIWHDYVI